jgi:hypothetical protein
LIFGEGCLEKSLVIFQKFFWVKICILKKKLGFFVIEFKICDHGSNFAWEGFSKSIKFSEEYKYNSKPNKGNAK